MCYRKFFAVSGSLLNIFMLDMRSYRGPNGEGNEETYGPAAYFLGPRQIAWLKPRLREFAGDVESHHQRGCRSV